MPTVFSRYFRCEIETLQLWKLVINAANAMQRAALALASKQIATVEDIMHVERWEHARTETWDDPDWLGPRRDDGVHFFSREFWDEESDEWFAEYQRAWLVSSLNYWLACGELLPQYEWRDGRLELGFWSQPKHWMPYLSLMGALGIQLAHAVAGTETTAVCTACGKPFFAARKRAASRDRYCETCGIEAARRAAKVRYNAKRKRTK